MNLETRNENGIIILKPESKSIDATVSTTFKGQVVDLINQGNIFFLLNLSQVDFIDSSGLGAIISILKGLQPNKGEIVLCDIREPVLNLFKLTRMDLVFKIYLNEKEGLDFLINAKKKSISISKPDL